MLVPKQRKAGQLFHLAANQINLIAVQKPFVLGTLTLPAWCVILAQLGNNLR